MKRCPDCNHNTHEPNKCGSCNCGQSAICHPASRTDVKALKEVSDHLPDSTHSTHSTLIHRYVDAGHRVPRVKVGT
ncbi:MAG: hypothetical protein V7638_3871 [Acidobacteriota bacterium]|jgi:hypothetical protein